MQLPSEAVVAQTRAAHEKEDNFGPIDEFYAARRAVLTDAGIKSEG